MVVVGRAGSVRWRSGTTTHLADGVEDLARAHGDLLGGVVLRDAPDGARADVQPEVALNDFVEAVLGHARSVDEVEAAPVDDGAPDRERLALPAARHERERGLDLGRAAAFSAAATAATAATATVAARRGRAKVREALAPERRRALAQRERARIQQVGLAGAVLARHAVEARPDGHGGLGVDRLEARELHLR